MNSIGVPRLEDLETSLVTLKGKRILVRCDFNVPLRKQKISDDLRIRAALPTLEWLIDRGAEVVACTHLGRPEWENRPSIAVEPVRARLKELNSNIEILENLRFDSGETTNSPEFVSYLISGAGGQPFDGYVNDAFGASHRSHASVVGPPKKLPSAAGRLLEREVEVLGAYVPLRKNHF